MFNSGLNEHLSGEMGSGSLNDSLSCINKNVRRTCKAVLCWSVVRISAKPLGFATNTSTQVVATHNSPTCDFLIILSYLVKSYRYRGGSVGCRTQCSQELMGIVDCLGMVALADGHM